MDSVYERALNEVGQNGKFQIRFDIVYNLVFTALWATAYNSILLALVIIPHSCELPNRPENVSALDWKSKYIPMVNDTTGKTVFSSCQIYVNPDENNVTKSCDVYSYNRTWYESTVSSENNWVCDDQIYVANVFAYSKIGEAVGSVLFGWFGDIYGRRLSYIVSLGLLVLGRVVSVFSSHLYIIFVIGCIIASFPSWTVVQSATVISMEISAPDRRSTIATLRTIGYSAGMCLMPLLYWWLRDWKTFMIVTTATQVPFLMLSWKILESPRWLWVEGKTESCLKELNKIAKVNHTKLEDETKEEIFISKATSVQAIGPLSLFSGWRLAINTILQLYLWVSVSLSYIVLLLSSGEKTDANPFLEFAWQSMVELPATFAGAWLADNLGRRYAGATAYSVSALMWILMSFRLYGTNTWLQEWWVGSTLIVVNRFASTVSYYVIYLFNMELYPTCLRQSGMSLGNVFSSGGSAMGAYLMHLGRLDARIPGAVLFVVALLGTGSTLLLPETLNATLPETIQDAREFGRRNRTKYGAIKLKTEPTRQNPSEK
ncbi:solute carrier family 22 member 7 isoform X1 [Ostrinia furnacalis]|uniref:solute carrier family 22 member 7 isoform X1 n=2 Tax=Ostrinia furnacalis TaxID=93504 RepID=UPI00103D8102|nr:solute carrier family 22 member 7 isoform X1 [Ostrinia furnacalis]